MLILIFFNTYKKASIVKGRPTGPSAQLHASLSAKGKHKIKLTKDSSCVVGIYANEDGHARPLVRCAVAQPTWLAPWWH
jgi:hypothetical protein